ncbi:MAG: PfkB family carbohydrate kinase [Pseudomonadota bacterium]|nr:PfkB family carbohydrate kinase [Pseudomonadota bacterium]
MPNIVVIGSLAYDSIYTPSGAAERALGGSSNYFSLAASLYTKVRVVGVVGEDYLATDLELLTHRGVDVSGVQKLPGKTFHWAGKYEGDLNEAQTLVTELNVFETFSPKLPEKYRDSEYVFLANIDPDLQMSVLEQVKKPRVIACDTMNFWISSKLNSLKKVIEKVDVLLINEGEAKILTGAPNAIAAAPLLNKMGPKAVVIKRGEYGFALYHDSHFFILPAFPISKVIDPTGAGDTFAGGFMSYLAQHSGDLSRESLRNACIRGSMLASFTVQDFSIRALLKLSAADVEKRQAEYRKVISL